MQQPTVLPFMMFQGEGSAALDFYRSLFPDLQIEQIERYRKGEAGPEGSIKLARFSIGRQSILCSDSYVKHGFSFTPSFSLFVECGSEQQIRSLTEALTHGGAALMPLGAYGFGTLFAWVTDRFGVSWQLRYA